MDFKEYLIARLSEPSTWRGLINLLMAVNIYINPDFLAWIVSISAAINGGIGLLAADTKGKDVKNEEIPS